MPKFGTLLERAVEAIHGLFPSQAHVLCVWLGDELEATPWEEQNEFLFQLVAELYSF